MKIRSSFLIKAGLGVALLAIIAVIGAGGISKGHPSLEKHEQWLRLSAYPVWTVKWGYYLETYVESPVWQRIRNEIYSESWVLAGVVLAVYVYSKKPKSEREMRYWGTKLALVVAAAVILYVWRLGDVPNGVYVDEATVGYNASQLLVTGRDEYGVVMPVLFKFFGAYTPGLVVYLLVPLIKVFGLGSEVIRSISVFAGVVSVLVMWAILKRILLTGWGRFWGTAFFSILPWTVFNARLGYEVMFGFALYFIGMYFWYRAAEGKYVYLKWAVIALSLSSYAAHVHRYLLPFLVMGLGWSVRGILKNRTETLKTSVVLVVSQLPNILLATTAEFWVKNSALADNPAKIFGQFVNQLAGYFSPITLFLQNQDIDLQHQIPGLGLMYWWMVVPAGVGFLTLLRSYRFRQSKFVLIWLIVSIVPAAFSGVFISVQRALPMLAPLGIILAVGIERCVGGWNEKIRTVGLAGLFFYCLILLWRGYFVMLPKFNAAAWNYEYKQLAKLRAEDTQNEWLIDSTRNPRSYMLMLFYNANTEKTQFEGIDWKRDECRKVVLVGDKLAISPQQVKDHMLEQKFEISDPMGEVRLMGFATQPIKKCPTNGKILF